MSQLDWQLDANCGGIDTEMFFNQPPKKTYENPEMLTRICNNCIVKSECLDYALKVNVRGWWGGTDENKRRKLRRKLNIIPRPVVEDRYQYEY